MSMKKSHNLSTNRQVLMEIQDCQFGHFSILTIRRLNLKTLTISIQKLKTIVVFSSMENILIKFVILLIVIKIEKEKI